MRFLRPELASWLVGALAIAAIVRWRAGRRFAASSTVRWMRARHYRASIVRRLPIALLIGSLVLVGLALMEPVIPFTQADVESRGLDIVVVLDLSSSMEEDI